MPIPIHKRSIGTRISDGTKLDQAFNTPPDKLGYVVIPTFQVNDPLQTPTSIGTQISSATTASGTFGVVSPRKKTYITGICCSMQVSSANLASAEVTVLCNNKSVSVVNFAVFADLVNTADSITYSFPYPILVDTVANNVTVTVGGTASSVVTNVIGFQDEV